MNKLYQKFENRQSGMTLVEVLISIVLLMIVLTIFLSVFVQSESKNTLSEQKISATYIAQEEMEYLYDITKESDSLDDIKIGFENRDEIYYHSHSDEDWLYYETQYEEDEEGSYHLNYYSIIRVENNEEDNLYHVIVEVYQDSDDSLQAKMQNVLTLRGD